jgi:hypothetical protein
VSPAIVPIVEGFAEVQSLPVLLRRLLQQLSAAHVDVARPFRVKRHLVVKEGELERAVAQAVRTRPGTAAVLLVLDADDDCPAELGPSLLARCRSVCREPVSVVLACRELEAWFLAGKESLRGVRGIRADAEPPERPEAIRGAKECLSRNMEARRYLGVDDQAALMAGLDVDLARQRSPSLDRLVRAVQYLVEAVGGAGG